MPLKPITGPDGEITGYEYVSPTTTETKSTSAGDPTTAEDGDATVVGEIGRAAAGGVLDAGEEIIQTVDYLAGSAAEALGFDVSDEGFITDRVLWSVDKNQTTAGQMARGLVQFLAGFGVAGKALRGVGMGVRFLRGTSAVAQAGRAALQGGVTDFAAFDAHEARLSDFLRENAGLRDPVTEFLASDEDDSVALGKLKNTLEGLGIGVAVDGLLGVLRGFRSARRVRNAEGPEAAAKELDRHVDEVKARDGDVDDPNLGSSPRDGDDMPNAFAREEHEVDDLIDATTEGERRRRATGIRDETAGEATPAVNATAIRSRFTAENIEKAVAERGPDVNFTELTGERIFRWDMMDSAPTSREAMRMVADELDPARLPQGKTLKSMEISARRTLEELTGEGIDQVEAAIKTQAKDASDTTRLFLAGKVLAQDLGREIHSLATKIDEATKAGRESVADEARLVRYIGRLGELEANLKTIQTTSAQTTVAGRIRTRDGLTGEMLAESDILAQTRGQVSVAGGSRRVRDLAGKIRSMPGGAGDLHTLGKLGREARKTGFWDVHNEYWINSILSGPKTHLLNLMSNAAHSVLLPMEHIVGGVLRGDRSVIRHGARLYAGMLSAIRDSFKMSGTAFWRGENLLDPQAAIREGSTNQKGVIGSSVAEHPDSFFSKMKHMWGQTVRLPSRFLLTGDEFFKQMNYRSSMYARAMDQADEAVEAGLIRRKDVAAFVADRVEASIEKGTGRGLGREALEHAREVTFTRELDEATLGRSVSDLVNKHPGLRILMPFVRTPTNIMRAVAQRTPLVHRINRQMMDDLVSSDPIRASVARGKLATGTMLWTGAITLAMEGRLTGGGPNDPRVKARLLETGWRPYSFRFGDETTGYRYVEFRRMDPFATFFGIAADIADMGAQLGEQDLDDLAAMGITAVANNLVSKTYLTGLIEFTKALTMPDWYAESFLYRQASTYTPFSSLMRTARQEVDPVMREVRNFADAFRNTIPGLSETVPARVSWITGEPFVYPKGWGADTFSPVGEALAASNPILASADVKNPVLSELARLQHGFTPPSRRIGEVELEGPQYERLLALHGTIRLGRFTLQERLSRLMESHQYTVTAERRIDPDQFRLELIRDVISDYREAARRSLLGEDAKLASAVAASKEADGFRLRSGTYGALGYLSK